MNNKPNFLECEDVESANKVNLEDYTFLHYSESRTRYIFKIRERKNSK